MHARFVLVCWFACLAQSAAAEVLVGVSGPLTGRFAEQGAAIRKGVEEVVAQANAARSGPLGESLKVVAVDDGCGAKSGIEAARALVAQKVAVVIGHNCASAALAAAPVYAAANTILLSLTRHPDLTDKRAGPTIFRIAGRDDRQGEAIANYVTVNVSGRRVAFVHDRTQYARSLTAAAQRKLGEAGITPVLVEGIVAGEREYGTVATRILQVAADAVVFAGYPSEARVVLQSIRNKGSKAAFVAGDAIGSAVSLEGLEGAAVVKASTAVQLVDGGPEGQEGINSALAMLATRIWLRAVASGDTVSEPAVARILQSLAQPALARPAPTLTGPAISAGPAPAGTKVVPIVVFEPNGDAGLPSFRIHKVTNGKLGRAE